MDSFNGTWIDQQNVKITVTEKNNIATVTYSNGRGPFHGFEVNFPAPVLTVDFTDDAQFSGVLSKNGTSIYWNNGTTWKKA